MRGQVKAEAVASISIEDIRVGGPNGVTERLGSLARGSICVVNAASMRDLQVFTRGLLMAEARGQRFLYRTAASFVQVRAGLAPRPLLTRADFDLSEPAGGLIVVGSYVPRTTSQVNELLAQSQVVSLECRVEALLDDSRREDEIGRLAQQVDQALRDDRDVMVYTSRQLRSGEDAETSLSIGHQVSEALVAITRAISTRPRYLLAKGGITSSDVATHGLDVKRALVLGQILPGVPVWQLGEESRYPSLTYIVFPGNVGGSEALVDIVTALRTGSAA